MKESYNYKKLGKGKVQCLTCSHFCALSEEERGKCGVRENIKGKLFALNYGKLIASNIDPIEKKPLFHFLPGTFSYSISTVGCNLACDFCQNWDISQGPKPPLRPSGFEGQAKNPPVVGKEVEPEDVVKEALNTGCQSISYTYTEPTIFLEYALDTMKIAKKKGLFNVWVSNGFMSPQTLKLVIPYLDAVNVDIKSFSEKFYEKVCKARLEPVLENLKELYKKKVHLEATTLIIPTLNDSKENLQNIARFIKKELSPEVPWHISRFFPAYRLSNLPPTDVKKIHQAYDIGKKEGLKFVYAGNIPGDSIDGITTESTYCPKCGKLAVGRAGFEIYNLNLDKKGRCKYCKTDLNIFTPYNPRS